MTEQEKQELSKAVADKYGIDAYLAKRHTDGVNGQTYPYKLWLHDDSARCFDLMVEHDMGIGCMKDRDSAVVYFFSKSKMTQINEHYTDHPTKQEATRIAILRALLAKD